MLDNRTIEGIPEFERLKEWADVSEKYGIAFEYNDFFNPDILDDKAEVTKRVNAYKSIGRDTSKDTLHGIFFDMTINSCDKKIRQISRDRFRESMDIAESLNCRGVVFHTNYLVGFKSERYKDSWVESCSEFYHELCSEYKNVNVYVENMFDNTPALLKRLADKCSDLSNFGVCLDVSHALLWVLPLDKWFDALNPYIKHMHINDSMLMEDDHLPLGEGKINYGFLKTDMVRNVESVLLEVTGLEAFKKSYSYLSEKRF